MRTENPSTKLEKIAHELEADFVKSLEVPLKRYSTVINQLHKSAVELGTQTAELQKTMEQNGQLYDAQFRLEEINKLVKACAYFMSVINK